MLKLIAIWNGVRGAWEKPTTAGLLCEHSEPYLETWPSSGTMRTGQVFELPTPELHTNGAESSSSRSVPTPTAVTFDGSPRKIASETGSRGVDLAYWAKNIPLLGTITTTATKRTPEFRHGVLNPAEAFEDDMPLLRTPIATEIEGGAIPPDIARARGQTIRLTAQVLELLPTPTTQEGSGICRDHRGDMTHALTCDCKPWGQYAPAIARWEAVTGRSAPPATLPDGRDGKHRLSSRFTEWLMGLADGWITGHGISRRAEIKMAGNGVVPQQAELALDILYHRTH